MKIENLKVGMILKNYKELCSVLEIEPTKKANNQRLSQFKELDRYCKYHKEGHKIIIDVIFKEVKEKVDKRTNGNNNELSRNIRYVILHLCNKNKLKNKSEIGYSKTFLYGYCGMINENYRDSKGNKNAFAEYLNVEKLAIDECFDYTDDRMCQALRRALSSLTSYNKALGYRYGYNYVTKEDMFHHTADVDLENTIRDIESKVMNQMGFKRYDKLFESGVWNEFKFRVINTLKREYPLYFGDLKYYYNAIVLNYKDSSIKRTIETFENTYNYTIEKSREAINKQFSKSLDGTITRRNKKNENLDTEDLSKVEIYRGSKNYVKEQTKVKNTIIKKDAKKVDFKATNLFDVDDENVNYEQLNMDIPF